MFYENVCGTLSIMLSLLKNAFSRKGPQGRPQGEYRDITQHEIEALKHDYNLSDAHTHQSQSPTQKKIIGRLPELWYEAEKTKVEVLENKFVKTFFEFRQQPFALQNKTFLLAYAASISTEIMGHYLAQKNLTVSVLEPCFDNLVDLLKLAKNKLEVLPEETFYNAENLYDNLSKNVHSDVLYITDPNNPTGQCLTIKGQEYWAEIIRFCKDNKKFLAVDMCFAPMLYVEEKYVPFDFYQMLEESGISYIILEDTGKSFPILDMKVSILKSSKDVYKDLYNISTIYLLQVSPFALRVLIEYLDDAIKTNFEYTKNLILKNWQVARSHLDGSMAVIQEPDLHLPLVWCKLSEGVNGDHLKKFLEENYEVHVVPGKYFFWSDREGHREFIRIALARDSEILEESMAALRKGLDEYEKTL